MQYKHIFWISSILFIVACGIKATDKYPTIEDDERLQNLNKRLCESKGRVWNSETQTCTVKV